MERAVSSKPVGSKKDIILSVLLGPLIGVIVVGTINWIILSLYNQTEALEAIFFCISASIFVAYPITIIFSGPCIRSCEKHGYSIPIMGSAIGAILGFIIGLPALVFGIYMILFNIILGIGYGLGVAAFYSYLVKNQKIT